MTITTIALHVEPGSLATVDAALTLPVALARAHSAHVTALVFTANVNRNEKLECISASAEGQIAAHEIAVEKHVRSVLDGHGLQYEVRGRSSFAYGIGEVFADQTRVSDLGVMSFGSDAGLGARFVALSGLFASGRPLLLSPDQASSPPSRIVVAWDATPAAVRAIHGALPLMQKAEKVTVVSLSDDKEFRSGQSGTELTRLIARHGANSEFLSAQRGGRSVMAALLEAAEGARADLLVMGAVRHSRLHNFVYGSATQDLLDRGPALPILLAG